MNYSLHDGVFGCGDRETIAMTTAHQYIKFTNRIPRNLDSLEEKLLITWQKNIELFGHTCRNLKYYFVAYRGTTYFYTSALSKLHLTLSNLTYSILTPKHPSSCSFIMTMNIHICLDYICCLNTFNQIAIMNF